MEKPARPQSLAKLPQVCEETGSPVALPLVGIPPRGQLHPPHLTTSVAQVSAVDETAVIAQHRNLRGDTVTHGGLPMSRGRGSAGVGAGLPDKLACRGIHHQDGIPDRIRIVGRILAQRFSLAIPATVIAGSEYQHVALSVLVEHAPTHRLGETQAQARIIPFRPDTPQQSRRPVGIRDIQHLVAAPATTHAKCNPYPVPGHWLNASVAVDIATQHDRAPVKAVSKVHGIRLYLR